MLYPETLGTVMKNKKRMSVHTKVFTQSTLHKLKQLAFIDNFFYVRF